MSYTILQGNALDCLRELPDCSVHCCVTSPPFWGLRDYGTATWDGGDAGCDHKGPYLGEKAATFSVTPFRDVCGIELNPEYIKIAERRLAQPVLEFA